MAMALAHAGNGTAPSLAARPAAAEPRLTGATLSAQSLRAPAAALSALGSPWNTLAPQGTLELKWQTLPLGGRLPAGPLAELRWRDAATALAPVNPVGSYVLRLQGDGKSGGALALSTESGLLDVSGQGSLSRAARSSRGARPMPPRRTWPNARRWTACCPRWDDGRRMW